MVNKNITRKSPSRYQNTSQKDFSDLARKFILILIPLLAIIITIAIVCTMLLSPEHQVKNSFESLARHYYENVFYENMLDSNTYSGDPAKALEKYESSGLNPVNLRQLILLDENNNIDTDYILKYCDSEQTTVKYFPESPYSKTSYHTEYSYSCNF